MSSSSKVFKVLVLLKPGDEQPALERAADFARFVPELEITALLVLSKVSDGERASAENNARRELDELRARHPSIVHFNPKVAVSDDVAEAFISESRAGHDLAIIPASRRHTIRDLFVSPVDSSILRGIGLPVLIIKDAKAPQKLGQAIVIAIDLKAEEHDQRLDDVLVEKAKRFAERFNGVIHVANCITPQHRGYMGGETLADRHGPTPSSVHHDLVTAFARRHGLETDNCHVLNGRVDEEIPRLCSKLQARMVCMGYDQPEGGLFGDNSSSSELVLEQIHGDLFVINRTLV